jgi:CRISPR-associated protein Cas1
VLVLRGYGLRLSVERGYLVLEDGIADRRRVRRLSRIDRTVKRVTIVGHAGTISLDAIRWLHDVKLPLIHLDVDGRVLATVCPDSPEHPQLRRGQALAAHCDEGVEIVRRILIHKVTGQREILRSMLRGQIALGPMDVARRALQAASDMVGLRTAEAQAAAVYWRAWEGLPVAFTQKDERRVPLHWRTFGTRSSPLTHSPRLAANPANALLNYLYSLLEAEARIALLAVGCDPGLGIHHADQDARDSMACDVMEAVRPRVDAWLMSYLESRVFARRELFEAPNGNCRLTLTLAQELAQTVDLWAEALAPVVEDVAERLYRLGSEHGRRRWLLYRKPAPQARLTRERPTPLTQRNRQRSRPKAHSVLKPLSAPEWSSPIVLQRPLARNESTQGAAAPKPPVLTEADLSQHQHHRLMRLLVGMEPLTRESFLHGLLPALREISAEDIAPLVGLSISYCARIRAGACVPRKKHWEAFRAAIRELT